MPVTKLKEFLDKKKVKFVSIRHSTAYTAQEIAASAHVKGRNLAKSVVVKLDGSMALAVLPAKYQIDFDGLRKAAKAKTAALAEEEEFTERFPGCETGAMPPFGNLYDLPVYVDETLSRDEEIAFNACSHTELIQIAYKDFARLVKPKVANFSVLK
ncbi:MAG: YbaK/EbsC family protein [Spirochaetales bacterium]|nr:YbaK/EbsC family protein [Spirochaetales bacterium]